MKKHLFFFHTRILQLSPDNAFGPFDLLFMTSDSSGRGRIISGQDAEDDHECDVRCGKKRGEAGLGGMLRGGRWGRGLGGGGGQREGGRGRHRGLFAAEDGGSLNRLA